MKLLKDGYKRKSRMLWRKKTNDTREKNLNTEEYALILKRISEINFRIESLEGKFRIFETDYANLRGKFNQRLKGMIKEEEQQEEQKDINISSYVPFG